MRPMRDMVRHTVVYGIGSVGVSLVSFVLIPVYTRYLSTEEYGILALFLLLQAILSRFYDLGLTNSVGRFFFDFREGSGSAGLDEMVSTALVFLLVYALVLSSLLVLVAPQVAELLVGDSALAPLARVMAITLLFEAMAIPALTLLRMEERSGLWVGISLFRVVGSLCLNIYLVVFRGLGVFGVLLSFAVVSVAVFFLTSIPRFRRVRLTFDTGVLRRLLAFGLPFLPVLLGILVIDLSDRYVLQWFRSTEEVGIYSLGYKIGQIMMLAVSAFSMGWAPLRYRIYEREDATEVYRRICTLFAGGAAFLLVGISVYGHELVWVAATPEYFSAARIIPFAGAGYVLYGLHLIATTGMGVTKKTRGLPLAVLFAAGLNLLGNLLLIPPFGMMGAAVATVLAYLVLVVATDRLSQRHYAVPYEWGRIAIIGAVAGGIVALDTVLQPEGVVPGIVLGSILLLIFLGTLPLVGVVTPADFRAVRLWLREMGRGKGSSVA
jgi:O-antigen/teichoic acid export membrane protein